MPRILVDLSHNERYSQIPNGIFNFEYNFEFLYPGMHFPEHKLLRKYDLIILGEIIPAQNEMDHLFLKTEIEVLKQYVNEGGRLLVSSSSGGDFDYVREDDDIEDFGSIRALSTITGIKRYWWGELFHPSKGYYYKSPENLQYHQFPPHPIFNGISKIMLADTTFLEPSTVFPPEILFSSRLGTMFRYYIDDSEECVDEVPVITYRKYGEGACMVIGTTLFMSKHENFGSSQFDNGKFFFNLVKWLLSKP